MKFIVSGKNIEVTEALRDRVTRKLGKLGKFLKSDTEVHSTFSTEKNKHIVEVTIPFNGVIFRAEEKNDDMYTSIDKIVDILEGQIRKNKTKLERKNKGVKDSISPLFKVDDAVEKKFKVLEIRKYSIKPMTIEEAMMQLDLENEEYLIFVNAQTKEVNKIYKLKDGGYGLVEPEF